MVANLSNYETLPSNTRIISRAHTGSDRELYGNGEAYLLWLGSITLSLKMAMLTIRLSPDRGPLELPIPLEEMRRDVLNLYSGWTLVVSDCFSNGK